MARIEGWPRVQIGTRLRIQDIEYTLVGFTGGDTALLEDDAGGIASVLLRVVLTSPDVTVLGVDGRIPPIRTSLRLEGLDGERRRQVERLAADLHQVEYGRLPDDPDDSEPAPAYDPSRPMMERQAAKLVELAERGTPMGSRPSRRSWPPGGVMGSTG